MTLEQIIASIPERFEKAIPETRGMEWAEVEPEKVISHIKSEFDLLLSTLEGEIETKHGKKGQMNGSMGFQGLKMGITAFQRDDDRMRDSILSIIHAARQALEKTN